MRWAQRRATRRGLLGDAGLAGLALVAGCAFRAPSARQPPKATGLGLLTATTTASSAGGDVILRDTLRELGYVEGQNLVIHPRFADGEPERLPALAAELVSLHVDVIATTGTAATVAASQTTATIPIVQRSGSADLVAEGLVASVARPGGNVTGLSKIATQLSGKRLELLHEAVPGRSPVAVLWSPEDPTARLQFEHTQAAARSLSLALLAIEALRGEDLEDVFELALAQGAQALVVLTDPVTVTHQARIGALAASTRLPAVFDRRGFVEAGGLMAYGPNAAERHQRAALLVDKILKGAKPADLPIEHPMRFDFSVNLKTAQALGLAIPQHVLLQATEVIQ